METKYTHWKRHLLFTILQRTSRDMDQEQVEERAAIFDCLPLTTNGDDRFVAEEKDQELVQKLHLGNCTSESGWALMEEFRRMSPGERYVIEQFMDEVLFCDAMMSFIGFVSSMIIHFEGLRYPMDVAVGEFNNRFFCCKYLTCSSVECFINLCGDAFGLWESSNSTPTSIGWLYYMADWAISHRRSFWSFV